jgi:hypothetical protein
VSVPRYAKNEKAMGGVFDLTAADFSNSLYALNGEWEFYYGKLYTPADFADGTPEDKAFASVPHSWSEGGYPLYGCATYRLTVKTDEPELLILIPEIQNSSIVWMNGQRVFEAGKPGGSSSETVPGLRNAFVNIHPENRQIEIIVQAANYGWYVSGLRHNFEVARPDVLIKDAMTRRILVGVTIGLLLTVAIYHTMLFMYNRRERVYFVFALYCAVSALRFALEINGFAQLFLPDGMGVGLIRLYMATLFLNAIPLTLFIHFVFNTPVKKNILAVYGIIWAVPTMALLILPYGMGNFQIMYLSLIPMAMAFVSAVRSKQAVKNPYNILFMCSLGIMHFWFPLCKLVFSDALYMQGVVTHVLLVLCQCFMLSVSYAETKRNEEELIRKTDFYHRMAHDILTPLTKVSTCVQSANEEPDEAEELLSSAQAVIMEIAAVVNDTIRKGKEGTL